MTKELPNSEYFKGNEWVLPTDIDLVSGAEEEFKRRLVEAEWEDVDWLGDAFREALINAIVHGNLGIKGSVGDETWRQKALKEQANQEIKKSIHIKIDVSLDDIIVVIRDEGEGFDWRQKYDEHNLLNPSGRGRLFMQNFFDSAEYNEKGNEVTLRKKKIRL